MEQKQSKAPSNQKKKNEGVTVKGVKPPYFKKAGFGGDNPNDPVANGSCKRYFESLSLEEQQSMVDSAGGIDNMKMSWAYESVDDMLENLEKMADAERDRLIRVWERERLRFKDGQSGLICCCGNPGCRIGEFMPIEYLNTARQRNYRLK